MAQKRSWGVLPPYRKASLFAFPGLISVLGPGVIFVALVQRIGELIWWPYIIAKYGLIFLFLLFSACLLQFTIVCELGRYTMVMGKSVFLGFVRLNHCFALVLWFLMTLSFLWSGAFAAAV